MEDLWAWELSKEEGKGESQDLLLRKLLIAPVF